MIRTSICVVLAVALTGCGKKDGDQKTDKNEKRSGDEPAAGSAGAKKPAADLFTGKTVSLPEPIAKIKYGMPEAEAKAAAPDVFAAKYGYEVPGYEGVKITVQINDGRVFQPRLEIKQPIDTVKTWLAAKWGDPRAGKNAIDAPEYYWDAPDVGLSAKLESSATNSMLRFDPVMSFETALGQDPTKLDGDRVPKIGATQEELMKTFEAYRPSPRKDDPSSITFSLPKLAGSEYGVNYDVRIKDGKVSGYHISVPNMFNDKFIAKLEGSFGPGKLDSMKLYTDYKGPPKVKAEIRKDAGFATGAWVGDVKK